jgi:hypothetical protein
MRPIEVLISLAGSTSFKRRIECTAGRRNYTCTTYNCGAETGDISQASDHIGRSTTRGETASRHRRCRDRGNKRATSARRTGEYGKNHRSVRSGRDRPVVFAATGSMRRLARSVCDRHRRGRPLIGGISGLCVHRTGGGAVFRWSSRQRRAVNRGRKPPSVVIKLSSWFLENPSGFGRNVATRQKA